MLILWIDDMESIKDNGMNVYKTCGGIDSHEVANAYIDFDENINRIRRNPV